MRRAIKTGCVGIIVLMGLLICGSLMLFAHVITPLMHEGANVLILFNNTDEIRGSGGFTTAYMTITRQNDTFVTHFGSSYEIDTPSSDSGAVLVVPPPRPMFDYMGIDRWSFRDANWSPDYPTSAQAASRFYTQITDAEPPVYVITINLTAADTLMMHLPALDLGDESIDACTLPGGECPGDITPVISWIRAAWDDDFSGPDGDKSFIKDRATQLIDAVRALPFIHQLRVIPALNEMLTRGDLLLYSANPDDQAFFAVRGWSGPFPFAAQGNTLLYSENNIGYNKTSSSLEREFTYTIDFTQSPPLATLTIRYAIGSETGTRTGACQTVDSVGAYSLPDPSYEDRMRGCAWIYGQVYPIPGAKLIDYDVPTIPPDQFPFGLRGQTGRIDALQDAGVRGWGYVTVIPYGDSRTVTLAYTLPPTALETDNPIVTLPAIAGMTGFWSLRVRREDGSESLATYNVKTRYYDGHP